MTNRKDGGAAFAAHAIGSESQGACIQEGMSLRDWFAGMALQGVMKDFYMSDVGGSPAEKIAEICGEMADAMLAEREKAGSDE